MIENVFSKRLKEFRELYKLSQTELADALGISRGSISFYENGDRTPDIEILGRISRYFRISTDYLIGITDYHAQKEQEKLHRMLNRLNENIDELSVEETKRLIGSFTVICQHLSDMEINDLLRKTFIEKINLIILDTCLMISNMENKKVNFETAMYRCSKWKDGAIREIQDMFNIFVEEQQKRWNEKENST